MSENREKLHRLHLLFELLMLYVGLPTACGLGICPGHPFFALWFISVVCLMALIFDPQFEISHLWRVNHWKGARRIFVRFMFMAFLLCCYVVVFEPELFLRFPRHRPLLWALVMVIYPVLSVIPQGITHRLFLFHRYRTLFRKKGVILVSAAAFSYMHIVFKNPLALLLTFAGGILFAKTYKDTDSFVISSVEHALYGNYLFTIGLGEFLYLGAVG